MEKIIKPNTTSNEFNDGTLTVAKSTDGVDMYDFGRRAIIAREVKEDLELAEFEPLPSPRTVEIEPTLLCNARCHFCSYEQDIANFKKERRSLPIAERTPGLPKDVVISLLDSLKEGGTTTGLFWSGGGDPLVWPHIVEAIQYAATFAENSVQTNGISLGKFFKEPREALGAIRLLTVSTYADNPELHAEIAGVDSFNKVIENIKTAKELRDQEQLDLMIAIKIMVDAKNYRRLPDIVRFYREMGVDSVGLREVQDFNYGGEGQRAVSVELTSEQKRELCEVISVSDYKDPSLESFAKVVNQKVSAPVITSHCFNATDGHFACVDARGNTFIGNPEIGDEAFNIGNVTRQPWEEIWKGTRHTEVIKKMNDMQVKGICASALCRHVRANLGVQRYLAGEIGRQDREEIMGSLGAFL